MKAVINMRRSIMSLGLAALMLLIWPATALAATDPGLGSAGNFAVLAGTSITNTGPSWITGQIGAGVAAPAGIVGFPPGTSGPQHFNDAVYTTAETDLVTGYNGASQTTTTDYSNFNLGGLTLGPGVYNQSTAPTLTGTLTLNGPGIYIFKIGSTLVTATGAPNAPAARVVLINGAQPCDIFWQVASSATINAYTPFIGTIMAVAGIQMLTGATLWGRALARTAGVTLDTNRIIQPSGCTTGLTTNYAAPAPVASPAGNTAPPLPVVLPASLGTIVSAAPTPGVVPGSTGVPLEMRGQFPWPLLIAGGAGLGAIALGLSSRRRRRRA
ncbi:MAG: ice-binding family protein [Candidatus Dormibacteraeota bacterium]|nr:ice-binding family protein [Candidatus Dormibacteraeota bacterium]